MVFCPGIAVFDSKNHNTRHLIPGWVSLDGLKMPKFIEKFRFCGKLQSHLPFPGDSFGKNTPLSSLYSSLSSGSESHFVRSGIFLATN